MSTRFLTTTDGVRLAYSGSGSGRALIFERGWITHVELSLGDAPFRRFIEALGRSTRVIRYDHRGMGLSDRDVPVPDLNSLVKDLESVIDTLELEQAVVWGSNFGGPIAIRYAARHPDRVSKLILDTTFAQPLDLQVGAEEARLTATMIQLMRVSPEPALAYGSYLDDPTPESRHEDRVERARQSIAPEMLADLYLSLGAMDVEADAKSVRAPTLVLHRREGWLALSAGQRVASLIPGASFVGLAGRSTNLWEGDADTPLQAIADFLELPRPELATQEARGITVLLMTDLVESTAVTTRLGDAAAEPLQRFHDVTVRGALATWGGAEVSHTGDGLLARFSSAVAAVRCALRIQEGFEQRNRETGPSLHVRIGLNVGEPIGDGSEMFGAAVQKVARVCAAAGADEILVTPVVQALVEGKGFDFDDRGCRALKGFAEPVRLHALRR